MDTAQVNVDKALDRLRNFTARKETPTALKVEIEDKVKYFLIDPSTGNVKTYPAAYSWAMGYQFKELIKFFKTKGYKVEEVMGEIAPVLS